MVVMVDHSSLCVLHTDRVRGSTASHTERTMRCALLAEPLLSGAPHADMTGHCSFFCHARLRQAKPGEDNAQGIKRKATPKADSSNGTDDQLLASFRLIKRYQPLLFAGFSGEYSLRGLPPFPDALRNAPNREWQHSPADHAIGAPQAPEHWLLSSAHGLP